MKRFFKILTALALTVLVVLTLAACGRGAEDRVDYVGDVFVGYESCELRDGEVYAYDADGERIMCNNIFIEINGDVYYTVNNFIVYNQIIIDGAIYDFGEDGKRVTGEKGDYTYGSDGKLIGDNLFITVNGNVYFVINNVIVYNEIVIDGAIYDFGDDGKMLQGIVEEDVPAITPDAPSQQAPSVSTPTESVPSASQDNEALDLGL